MTTAADRPSLYEAAGGWPALLRLAGAHHVRCLADPVLEHPFGKDGHPDHVRRLAAYWAEVLGGPAAFSRECGGHSAVLALHAGNGGEHGLGERFAACFALALDDAGLPDDPALRSALRSYMDWAVVEVMSVSAPGSVPPDGLPTPRWSWDGLQQTPSG